MNQGEYNRELEISLRAVTEAEKIIQGYFASELDIATKSDNSPVTQADIEAEQAIREILNSAFPEYGYYGEETGSDKMDAEYVWLVDPIDGTKSFVRQMPFFSTQIALMERGEVVVGVSNAPISGERATAIKNQGAWINDQRITTSAVELMSGVFLSCGNIKSLAANPLQWRKYGDLLQKVARIRGYGDYCHYHQLAAGQADVVIESDVNILDIAALSLIVTEAGGCFSDLNGRAVSLDTTSVLATATASLHRQILDAL